MMDPVDLHSLRARLASDLEAGRFDRLHEYLGVSIDEASRIAGDLGQFAFASPGPPPDAAPPAGADGKAADFGPYRLGPELGRGGQGVVYRATDTRLGRPVALKLLTALAPQSPSALARFQREAQLTARLDDPCVCTVFDVGVRGSTPWMAMQFVDGETLAARIKRELDESGGENASGMRRRPVGVWIRLVARLARTLHAAHELGIVHRDIKPGNVMLRGNDPENPVLLDFGLAGGEDVALLTRSGDVMGTPAYMSPEQISRGTAAIDRRTDVYSLGVLLYECLTLRRPFRAPTLDRLYQDILSAEPTDPRRHNPQIGRDLAVVIATAMQRTRERRYRTALDLAEDLRRVAENRPILARPPGPWVRAIALVRRRPAAVLAVMLALVVIGAAGFLATNLPRWREDRAKAAETEDRERQTAFDARLRAAFRALHSGEDLAAAVASFRELAVAAPEDREARAGLALALCDLRRAAEAVPIVTAGPDTPEFDRLRAIVEAEVAADALGVAPLQRRKVALAADWRSPFRPGFDAVGCHLMALLERRENDRLDGFGEPRLEAEFARHALTLSPREPNLLRHLTWAQALARYGDRNQARTCMLTLRELWPNDREARRAALTLSQTIGDRFAYRSGLRALLAEDPADRSVRIELATALCDQGLAQEALDLVDALPDPDSTWLRGRALSMLGRMDEAVESLQRCVRRDPNEADGLQRLGIVLHEQGRPREARTQLERALAIRPADRAAWRVLWWTHRASGSIQAEATRSFATLQDAELQNLAEVEALIDVGPTVGRIDASEALAERAVARWPGQASLLRRRAVLHRLRGRIDASFADLDAALRAEPDHDSSLLAAAALHEYEGRDETARAIRWRTLDSSSPNPAVLATLRASYRARGELAAFERRLAGLRLDDFDADRITLERVATLVDLGLADRARNLLTPGPRDPSNAGAFVGAAAQLRSVVDGDPATDLPVLIRELTVRDERSASVTSLVEALTRVLRLLDDPARSRAILEGILSARPDRIEVRLLLLTVLYDAGETAAAHEVVRAGLAEHRDRDALLALCDWLWRHGHDELIEAAAARVLAVDSRSTRGWEFPAQLTMQRRDLGFLQRAVDAALAADPRNHVALSWQGWLALVGDDLERAVTLTRESLAIEPSAQATANLARIVPGDEAFAVLLAHAAPDQRMQSPALVEQCLGERTGPFYEALTGRAPDTAIAWQALADWHRRRGEPRRAIDALRRGAAALPHDADNLIRLGDMAMDFEAAELAAEVFLQARRAAPDDPVAAAGHAAALAGSSRAPEALELARRVWLAHPGEPSVHEVLFQLLEGDHRDATVRATFSRSLARIESALDRSSDGIPRATVIRHATARLCRAVFQRFGSDDAARLDLARLAMAAEFGGVWDPARVDFGSLTLPRFDGIVDALLDDGIARFVALGSRAETAETAADREPIWLLSARAGTRFGSCRELADRLRAGIDGAAIDTAAMRLGALVAYEPPPVHPLRAVGAASKSEQLQRSTSAWMPIAPNGGTEWLEVAFGTAGTPGRVLRIHHASEADGLDRVVASLGDGGRVVIPFDPTAFDPMSLVRTVALPDDLSAPVIGVRIELRTDRTPGWDGIDAVGIIDANGAVRWAEDARASSSTAWGRRPQV